MENKQEIRLSFPQNTSINPQKIVEKVNYGNKWVSYGENNLYPNYLWDLYLNSSTHQAIIDGSVDYTMGEGVNTTKDIIKVSTVARQTSLDYILFGGFAIEIIYNMIGEIVKINSLDFMKCRLNKDLTKVYYSNDWSGWNKNSIEYDVYNPNSIKKTSQILYFRGTKTRGIYPIPRYIGSTQAIETSIEIQNYHLNAIRNNFAASAIINFNNGEPTEQEKEQINRKIGEKFTGSVNASNFMLNFNENKETAITVERLEADKADEKFIQLSKDTKESIFVGHRVTSPSLFGMLPESGGFNSIEYQESFKLYNKTVIQPIQKTIQTVLSEVFQDNITFIPYIIPEFNPTSPTKLEITTK